MKDLHTDNSTARQWQDAYLSYREDCEEQGTAPEYTTFEAWYQAVSK